MTYPEWDARLSKKMRAGENRKTLCTALRVLAHSGDSWLWCGILFIFWLFSSGEREKVLAYWGGSIALTALFVFFLKKVISRKRPEGDWGGIYRKGDPYSFPSGHSVRAGVIIMLALDTFRNQPVIIAAILIWALLMALSRVATGLHYLLDILAGLALGLVIGAGWILLRPWIIQTFALLFNKSLWFR